jgi:hypothetical protein
VPGLADNSVGAETGFIIRNRRGGVMVEHKITAALGLFAIVMAVSLFLSHL